MKKPNRLLSETSPYLLQHAYNPVDWRPWNAESLQLAKDTNKMLLVSIGYSACHWCHVMEHESFEDESVAELMNNHFVCIKVDREERPDVDHVFMDAVQLMGGRGGWPLNCFALPDGRPVWGGTYFRKEQWKSILQQIAAMWEGQPSDFIEQAEQLTNGLQKTAHQPELKNSNEDENRLQTMADTAKRSFDAINGGSKGAPKFPMPDNLLFYLHAGQVLQDPALLNHVEKTLASMADGGIYDQIGGGFARYSVDDHWHIPHFEKMLYDNAQLIRLYASAFHYFKNPLFEQVVNETNTFLDRELKGSEGAYLSALDADSEGVEGKFYVWTSEEFQQLPVEDVHLISKWFGIGKEAYWENGWNVLVRPHSMQQFCTENNISEALFKEKLFQATDVLFQLRSKRIRPGLDDKRLLSWNALMIHGLTTAYIVFGKEGWLTTAQKTTSFILENMRQEDGGLFRSWKNGQAKIPAFLDDYSLLIQSLIAVYQANHDEALLLQAKNLTTYVIEHFYHPATALFHYTSSFNNDLAVKSVETYDNVIPSSNAAMCMALIQLGIYFEHSEYLVMAEKMLQSQYGLMEQYPGNFSHWGQAWQLFQQQPLLIVSGKGASGALKEVRKQLPLYMLSAVAEAESNIPVIAHKPFSRKLTFWFCDHNGCRAPLGTIDELYAELGFNALK